MFEYPYNPIIEEHSYILVWAVLLYMCCCRFLQTMTKLYQIYARMPYSRCMAIGHVNEHPTMHYFWIPRHTQSMMACKILTEYPSEKLHGGNVFNVSYYKILKQIDRLYTLRWLSQINGVCQRQILVHIQTFKCQTATIFLAKTIERETGHSKNVAYHYNGIRISTYAYTSTI